MYEYTPMSEDKLQRDVTRAQQAKALLETEIFKEAFTYLDDMYVQEWKTQTDSVRRARLWFSINALVKVREHLENVLANGKLAQREIDEMSLRKR